MNFKDWAPLKLVDSDLLSRVRLAYVFGKTGHEALIVTDEDEVFACGTNFYGCLGLESDGPQAEPVRIPELSNKEVKGFSSTVTDRRAYVCAYTFSGAMYYWGKDVDFPDMTRSKPTTFPNFTKKVLEVASGKDHCLILSTDGEVFGFGKNNYDQSGTNPGCYVCEPTLVQGDLKGRTVVKISCGNRFSVCVLDSGEVYGWGLDEYGVLVLGLGSSSYSSPMRVPALHGVIVRKIVCGLSYVLAVNDVGELFSWGCNDIGQLGLGCTTSDKHEPTKIEMIGKVINIAALPNGLTSAAMTENFKVYMWGACGGLKLEVPTETKFETLHEVFAFFSNPRIMHKPMSRHFQLESVNESIKNSFEDVETSNLTIVADNKEIFVHKDILILRSNYFKLMLKEPWLKKDDKSIELNQNYDGIHAYLQYLYTGKFKATPVVTFELLKIANEYQDLNLKNICEKSIRYVITVGNVACMFSWAIKLNAKKLAKYCVLFAGNRIGEVINTPGFSEWDKETYKKFIVEGQKRKIFRCYVRM